MMVELCSVEKCTGCGVCYNVCPKQAISMQADEEGFLRPSIDIGKCINCGLCRKVCPPLNPVRKHSRVSYPIAAINKELDVLVRSSSGGMFSLLADWTFAHQGVVYGVVMDAEKHVFHTVARNRSELASMRSSKYVQSDTRMVYTAIKADLKAERYVLFSGTPCQVAGLVNFLGKTDCSRLLTVDLVCHGTPSHKMFEAYLSKLAASLHIDVEKIEKFGFRQEESWGITPRFFLAGKPVYVNERQNLYMRLFLSSYLFRPCCYTCAYTTPERVGDITIADFWGIGEKVPFRYDTSRGCSLVLPNSEKGNFLFNEVAQGLNFEQREWAEALKYNHQLYRQSRLPKDRSKAIESLFNKSLEDTYNEFYNTPIIRLRRCVGKVLRKLHLRK